MSRARKPDSTTVEVGLAAWADAHPAATLLEIEHAVDRHLSAYRAALIGEAAQRAAAPPAPACPAAADHRPDRQRLDLAPVPAHQRHHRPVHRHQLHRRASGSSGTAIAGSFAAVAIETRPDSIPRPGTLTHTRQRGLAAALE